ncbi:hypothetical protein M408DRAFT_6712 [Serendipita vermifera MAFF 305830]|uniref:Uncharacterized protein n=1 Tax=Serendipita vermifera MAFF 305830 TaxID=933852 RepID=A0A0C3BHD9_SERVB|nr:hypothetical protein M408DRAFT_6712 [Serendipita vermifera MAFF 305830]
MSFSFHRNSSKSKDKAKVDEPMLDVTSGGGASSTSRPATPSGTQKPKNKFKFWSSRPKSVSEQSLPPAPDQNQQAEETRVPAPPQPFIVAPMETPFKGGPDDRAYEVEIYANGVTAVTCLQKLAGLTGPGTPNPLPIILEALVGVLTQLQKMVKNDGDWKTLFLLIAEHLDTFNNQLRLLALAEVTPDPESALHKPIDIATADGQGYNRCRIRSECRA